MKTIRRKSMGLGAMGAIVAGLTALTGGEAQAQRAQLSVTVVNQCDQRMRVYARYRTVNGNWVTSQRYYISAGQSRVVARTNNTVFYYSAFTDGHHWAGNDKKYWVNLSATGNVRIPLGFRKRTIDHYNNPHHVLRLNCDGDKYSGARYRLHMTTTCKRPLMVAIRHKNKSGRWENRGFWTVSRDRVVHLPLMYSRHYRMTVFYKDNGRPFINGPHRHTVRGKTYSFADKTWALPYYRLLC